MKDYNAHLSNVCEVARTCSIRDCRSYCSTTTPQNRTFRWLPVARDLDASSNGRRIQVCKEKKKKTIDIQSDWLVPCIY
ncbi:hypothetical protein VTN31DRAFT_743 [Thermomyces dupontii]|uniref:uncharacterized protein n=1 Tax=Talaromyces thermophilus TaxID=28565 RepID=UPI0037429276